MKKNVWPNNPKDPALRTCRGPCKSRLMPTRFCDRHRHKQTCLTCCSRARQGPAGPAPSRPFLSPIMVARIGTCVRGSISDIARSLYGESEQRGET